MHTKTKTKNTLKVLVSLIIAFAMVGVPATVFTANAQPTEYDFDLEAQEPPLETGCEELINITFESPEYIGNVIYHAILKDTEMSAIGDIMVEYTDSEPGTWYSPDMYMDGNDTVIVVDPMGGSTAPFDPGVSNLTVNVTFCEADTYDVEMVVYNETNMVKKYDEMFTLDVEDGFDMTVQVNGNDPDGTTFPDVVLLVDTVNITADFNATCATVTSAHVYFTAMGSASGGEETMDQAADGTWYWQSAQDPLVNGWTLGEWEFQINATTDGPCDPWISGTYNFTVVEDETDPSVEIEFGDPSYVGPDPEPWHDLDGPISGDSDATWITSTTAIDFNATDPEGIATVHFRMWNFTHGWGDWKNGLTTDINDYFGREDECKHKIEYYAEDTTGNLSETYFTFFYVDDTSPDLTVENDAAEGCGDYVADTTEFTLTADDGEWDLQNKSCPSGVDYINYSFDGGNQTTYTEPFTLEGLEPGQHYMEVWAYDNVGNEAYENITFIIADAPTLETTIEDTEFWHNDEYPKYEICDEIEFTATPTTFEDVTVESVTISLMAGSEGEYQPAPITADEFNMTTEDNVTWTYTFNDTCDPGEYDYSITVTDCTGQTATATGTFAVLPMYDIDVTGITSPDPSIYHTTAPTYINGTIKNNGLMDYEEQIDVHLQIYEEKEFDLEDWKCWDIEECNLNNFEIYDWNKDTDTWDVSTARAFSGSQSWKCTKQDTYEAHAHDTLILSAHGSSNEQTDKGIYIPETVEGNNVYYAYLNFSQWVEGEEDFDYGDVYIQHSPDGENWSQTKLDGGYYDTAGEWEYVQLDISDYVGQYVKFNWTWFADNTVNREGWYIDDICIKLQYGALQPLVQQGYKYVDGLDQGETKEFRFPLDFEPKNDTYYYFELYSDIGAIDYDGVGEVNGTIETDPRTGFEYWNPDNGVNESIYFGDICDAAVTSVSTGSEYEMPDEGGVHMPIDVTVENTGTLAKEIPVEMRVQERIRETILKEDFEAGADDWILEYAVVGNTVDEAQWELTEKNFYSPYTSVGITDTPAAPIGQGVVQKDAMSPFAEGGMQWEAKVNYKIMDPGTLDGDGGGLVPIFSASSYYWDLSLDAGRSAPYSGDSNGWQTFNADELIANNDLYWEGIPAYEDLLDQGYEESFATLIKALNQTYGPAGLDMEDFSEVQFGFVLKDGNGLTADEYVYIDDVEFFHETTGDIVYTDTLVTEELEQGETEDMTFWWNTTRYCDYIVTAETILDCDMNEDNNELSTSTRIYEQIYDDDYVEATSEDHTIGEADNWRIVEECTECYGDHYWYNGLEDGTEYAANADDVLRMLPYETDDNEDYVDVKNDTFDFTEEDWYNMSFFATLDMERSAASDFGFPNIDLPWDYLVVEVSNDSGHNWYPIEAFNNISEFTAMDYELYNPSGTGLLQTPHYYGSSIEEWFYYGAYPPQCPTVGRTDEMQFRFHVLSDSVGQFKGAFIDDVEITKGDTELFFDDMENGDANWVHMKEPTGDLWHKEADYWINADEYESWYNAKLEPWTYAGTAYFNDVVYDVAAEGYYRNNLDNTLTVTFNLTNAYQSTISWEQKYDFAGNYPEDYGVVEIWTDGAWKALFIVQGSVSDWSTTSLDISEYVGTDELTQMRFHMITNDTITGEGWQLRNFNVEGKVDNQAPTVTHELDPMEPTGNGGWYVDPVTVKLNAEDNIEMGQIKYRINGGSWLKYTGPVTIDDDGEYTIDYYAIDAVGNAGAEKSVSFKIDMTDPTGSLDFPQTGYIYMFGNELMPRILFKDKALIIGGLTATASASDDMSGMHHVTFTTNEDTSNVVAPYEYNLPFYFPFGSDTLTVGATDVAGNTATNLGSVDYVKIL